MPPVKRGKVAQAPSKEDKKEQPPPPAEMPTYAQQRLYLLQNGDEGPLRLTQEQERELAAEGIWPERQWSIWKHAITRGIQSY